MIACAPRKFHETFFQRKSQLTIFSNCHSLGGRARLLKI
nr:MAG TPA: hypothetical protein [Caudoviricetes sp.]